MEVAAGIHQRERTTRGFFFFFLVTIALVKCASIRDNGYHHIKDNCSHKVSKRLGTTTTIK